MNHLISEVGERCLLLSYSGDGTPITTRAHVTLSSGSETIRRAGRAAGEYYVHNVFAVAFDAFDRRFSVVSLEDPRPMSLGKQTIADLAFNIALTPQARDVGHRSILVLHAAWDRAKYEAISMMWKQRVIHQIASSSFDKIGMSQEEVFLHTWAFTTPLCLA